MNQVEKMTLKLFFNRQEKESLRVIANKITKVPSKIIIPTEYMINGEE